MRIRGRLEEVTGVTSGDLLQPSYRSKRVALVEDETCMKDFTITHLMQCTSKSHNKKMCDIQGFRDYVVQFGIQDNAR